MSSTLLFDGYILLLLFFFFYIYIFLGNTFAYICSWIFNNFNFPFSVLSVLPISGWTDEEANKDKTSAKKRRVETFQQKEKRKRDMGQATSDKTFVEEEKRILRQKLEWSFNNKVSYKDFFPSI